MLEGVTKGERSRYDGAVAVFAQEGGSTWFRSGGIDGFVRGGGAWRGRAGGGG